jgi:hypothetical protein
MNLNPHRCERLISCKDWNYEVLSKSSRNVSERKADTLKVLIATVPFKVVSLGSVHNDPNVSAMIGSSPGSRFVSASSVPSAFGLDLYGVKSSPFQLDFHLGGEEQEVSGLNQAGIFG